MGFIWRSLPLLNCIYCFSFGSTMPFAGTATASLVHSALMSLSSTVQLSTRKAPSAAKELVPPSGSCSATAPGLSSKSRRLAMDSSLPGLRVKTLRLLRFTSSKETRSARIRPEACRLAEAGVASSSAAEVTTKDKVAGTSQASDNVVAATTDSTLFCFNLLLMLLTVASSRITQRGRTETA